MSDGTFSVDPEGLANSARGFYDKAEAIDGVRKRIDELLSPATLGNALEIGRAHV